MSGTTRCSLAAWIVLPMVAMETMKKETNVFRTLIVEAPSEVVWKALTDQRLTPLSLGLILHGQLEVGRSFEWLERDDQGQGELAFKGTVRALQPGERLRYTNYDVSSGLPDELASRTIVDLHLIEEDEDRTRLELWQGDFDGLPQATRKAKEAGRIWVERLVGVKRVAEELSRAKAA